MPKKPLAIDLFCGCGGLTLGLRQAGFRVIGAVDNDPFAVETYKSNHPGVRVWECDIRDLPAAEVAHALHLETGDLHLLAGCPPCQGFSSMRTLNGKRQIEDPQNDLVFEFLRFVDGLRPRAIMMENVPGLAKDERFQVMLSKLEGLGYSVGHRIRNAADFGVPQRRRRLIMLAGKNGVLPFAAPDPNRKTVRESIGGLPAPGDSGDPLHDLPENRSERITNLIKRIPKDGGSRLDLGEEAQLPCHSDFDGFKDVYGRMAWNAVAPTITTGCFNPSKGRFLHPEEDRAITMREAALLQSFPKPYRFPMRRGKSAIAYLIGNALPPEFIRRIALPLVGRLREPA